MQAGVGIVQREQSIRLHEHRQRLGQPDPCHQPAEPVPWLRGDERSSRQSEAERCTESQRAEALDERRESEIGERRLEGQGGNDQADDGDGERNPPSSPRLHVRRLLVHALIVPHRRPGRHGTRCPDHDETPASCARGLGFVTLAAMTTTAITSNPLAARDASITTWPARHLRLVSTLAGLAWTALGLESIVRPEQHNYRDYVMFVPWVLTLVAIVGIHQIQRTQGGRLERWGFAAVAASMTVGALAAIPQAFGQLESTFAFVAPVWVLGMIVFGIGTSRAGVFPRWVGIALALSELLTMGAAAAMSPWVPIRDRGSFSGAVAHGVVFLLVSLAVDRRTRRAEARR
jgi:hypothetical protein